MCCAPSAGPTQGHSIIQCVCVMRQHETEMKHLSLLVIPYDGPPQHIQAFIHNFMAFDKIGHKYIYSESKLRG